MLENGVDVSDMSANGVRLRERIAAGDDDLCSLCGVTLVLRIGTVSDIGIGRSFFGR